MSRFYEMNLVVKNFNSEKEDDIKKAAEEEWEFDDWFQHEKTLSTGGYSSLCGGESEEEFSQRLTEAIWKVNGAFCEVEINATYLEELPFETYSFDEDDYQRFVDLEAEN